jgi:hypothetical protein
MKRILITAAIILAAYTSTFAEGLIYGGSSGNSGKRPYEDAYGNHYKKQENMYKDSDKDGVINYYEKNDRSTTPSHQYSEPSRSHSIPSYNSPTNLNGSRGKPRLY